MFFGAKTNTENLLKLKGFEEWVIAAGFGFVYCYWSKKEEIKAYGNEGIIVFHV